MRRVALLVAAAGLLVATWAVPGRAASCPTERPSSSVFFANERDYVTKVPIRYGDATPVRTIVTADIWVRPPADADALAFTVDYHLPRLDIREWMTQHIWPEVIPKGDRTRLGVWQQRTFPGVNVLDVHTRIGTARLCWVGE